MGGNTYYQQIRTRFSTITRERFSFILSLCVVISVAFDLLVSYIYYLNDPHGFIEYEATREAVHFFVEGAAPPMFFTSLIIYPLVIYFALWWFDNEKKKWPHHQIYHSLVVDGRWLFVFGIVATCFGRIVAGLTWYDGDTYIMNMVTYALQGVIIFTLGASMCTIVVLLLKNSMVKRIQKPLQQRV